MHAEQYHLLLPIQHDEDVNQGLNYGTPGQEPRLRPMPSTPPHAASHLYNGVRQLGKGHAAAEACGGVAVGDVGDHLEAKLAGIEHPLPHLWERGG